MNLLIRNAVRHRKIIRGAHKKCNRKCGSPTSEYQSRSRKSGNNERWYE